MNSLPLSESISSRGNGNAARPCTRAANTARGGLVAHAADLGPAGGDVGDGQRVAEVPGWRRLLRGRPGRSRRTPGVFSSQSAQVRIGICDFNRPARLGMRPALELQLIPVRRQPPVADMPHNSAAVASSMRSSPCRPSAATRPGRAGASRLPAGPSNVAQHTRNASMTASSYLSTGTRAWRGGLACPGAGAVRIALRAWSRSTRSTHTTHSRSPTARGGCRVRNDLSSPW
jgi:hypothetical protein